MVRLYYSSCSQGCVALAQREVDRKGNCPKLFLNIQIGLHRQSLLNIFGYKHITWIWSRMGVVKMVLFYVTGDGRLPIAMFKWKVLKDIPFRWTFHPEPGTLLFTYSMLSIPAVSQVNRAWWKTTHIASINCRSSLIKPLHYLCPALGTSHIIWLRHS